ncbi:hypothetical protein P7C70_g8954, partial [Phenoliferia sp. Uapishka_3]
LSLPTALPPLIVDTFHSLFFERLLVPQLLIGSRPFFAAAACGVLNGVILDIGARGEGSEISVVVESSVVERCGSRTKVDEGTCDDWLMCCMLEEDKDLGVKLGVEGDGEVLRDALNEVIKQLKEGEVIGFESKALGTTKPKGGAGAAAGGAAAGVDDDGNFDVAQVLVEGKVDKIVNPSHKKKGTETKKKKAGVEEEGDFVEVPHPNGDVDADPIRIGPSRHRYLEPLFLPECLRKMGESEEGRRLDLPENYKEGAAEGEGVQELIGVVVGELEDVEVRRNVWEGVVVVSSGKIGGIKGWTLSFFVLNTECELTAVSWGNSTGTGTCFSIVPIWSRPGFDIGDTTKAH